MTARRLLRLALLLAAALAGGCLVDPLDREYVSLAVALDTPPAALTGGAADAYSPWDAQGLFRLGQQSAGKEFPKLVQVAVDGVGKKRLAATWPGARQLISAGEDLAGEGKSGQVQVSLTVPSGPGYTISAVAWLASSAGLMIYRQQQAATVDLEAGKETAVSLDMAAHPAGSLEGAVRCKSGAGAPWQPYAVALVDAEALALYPPVLVVPDRTLGTYAVTIKELPLGRASWLRVTLRNASNQERHLDLRATSYALSKAGDKVLVNLQVPCVF